VISENDLWKPLRDRHQEIVGRFGTPFYIYNEQIITQRANLLKSLLGDQFKISYAVKANPNLQLVKHMTGLANTLDVSSYGEVEKAIRAGVNPSDITFSGPAKRDVELESSVHVGVGELVVESLGEASRISAICSRIGVSQNVLVRINPSVQPRGFGASMSGKASQFGIDEEQLLEHLPVIKNLPNINLKGFHIYSATNCLDVAPLVENFEIMLATFVSASDIAGIRPERLVFGSGFGVPYLPTESDLDIQSLANQLTSLFSSFLPGSVLSSAKCSLELGRWLVAPAGQLLTSVIADKTSRKTEIRLCDAGFNNHLAACGMMGSVIRRAWRIDNITSTSNTTATYNLVGPLCTSIDLLASNIELPITSIGDVLAVLNSGAYGYSASPQLFISHPSPRELWIDKSGRVTDATELMTNYRTLS